MTTLTTTDPRTDRAHFIAASSSQWLKCRTASGKKYGVPGQSAPGRYYLVDQRMCDCPDFQRRGGPCKHVLAVRLHVARVRAQQIQEEVKPAV
jgi:predicted nucleic acid-binding Zn finger protein